MKTVYVNSNTLQEAVDYLNDGKENEGDKEEVDDRIYKRSPINIDGVRKIDLGSSVSRIVKHEYL